MGSVEGFVASVPDPTLRGAADSGHPSGVSARINSRTLLNVIGCEAAAGCGTRRGMRDISTRGPVVMVGDDVSLELRP